MDYTNKRYDNGLYTKNMFVESSWELKLSLTEDLTIHLITEAYNKLVKEHAQIIQKGIKPSFELAEKIQAKDFLLNSIKPKA
jgi:hypothetical protein